MKKSLATTLLIAMIIPVLMVAVPEGGGAEPKKAYHLVPKDIKLRPKHGPMAIIAQDLADLYDEFQAFSKQHGLAKSRIFKSSNKALTIVDGEIVIDAIASGDPQDLMDDLNALGAEKIAVFGPVVSGRLPDVIKSVIFDTRIKINEFLTSSGTSYGHANAGGAEAVGASFYGDTPEFGTDPGIPEPYSSAGGVPILFDLNGNRLLSPIIRHKPGIVAPDGTTTTFFGFDIEQDGFPNFFGTSAAAPHAAAVAALLLDADPAVSPPEIYAVLEDTAGDMDDPATPDFDSGFDVATGYGLIRADLAVEAVLANSCTGNSDQDFDIDGLDLAAYLTVFDPGVCDPGESCAGDLDGDGVVNNADAIIFSNVFGQTDCLESANSAATANLK